ncbi:MAG TPA: response regulator [Chthoniobacteraceae bacterium]|jgi:CheY-like chemotaxis protein|nr:response regulator [Chthoniobacteraceae bacterium]
MNTIANSITTKEFYTTISVNRVLLLDDDSKLRSLIQRFLEAQFCTVVAVSNGVEGVRAVLKDDFDIVICDMMMPKMAGDKFYTAVERIRPDLCKRFLFITGYQGNCEINDFINRVHGAMLVKPFQVAELIETIDSIQGRIATR